MEHLAVVTPAAWHGPASTGSSLGNSALGKNQERGRMMLRPLGYIVCLPGVSNKSTIGTESYIFRCHLAIDFRKERWQAELQNLSIFFLNFVSRNSDRFDISGKCLQNHVEFLLDPQDIFIFQSHALRRHAETIDSGSCLALRWRCLEALDASNLLTPPDVVNVSRRRPASIASIDRYLCGRRALARTASARLVRSAPVTTTM